MHTASLIRYLRLLSTSRTCHKDVTRARFTTTARCAAASPTAASVASLQSALSSALAAGQTDRALRIAEECRAELAVLAGERSPAYASALNNLALVHKMNGDLAIAAPIYEQALAVYRSALGWAHPSVATTLANLGLLHAALAGRHRGSSEATATSALREHAEIALQYCTQAVEQRGIAASAPAAGPQQRASLAVARYQLATPLRLLGRFDEAEQQIIDAVAVLRTDGSALETATALNNLGFLYKEKRDHARAQAAYVEAAAIRESNLGPRHQDTISSLHNLAELLRDSGDEGAAVRVQRQILERIGDTRGAVEGGATPSR